MRNRFLTLSAAAALVPTFALAQQRPAQQPAGRPTQQPAQRPAQQPAARPAPARPAMAMMMGGTAQHQGAIEINVQPAVFIARDGALFGRLSTKGAGGFSNTGTPNHYAAGGQAGVGYDVTDNVALSVGLGFGSLSDGVSLLQITAGGTYTLNPADKTSLFVTAQGQQSRWMGANSSKMTGNGVVVGAGVRRFLSDNIAVRVDGRVGIENYSNESISPIIGQVAAGIAVFPSARKVLTSIAISPSSVTLTARGQTQSLAATARDQRGGAMSGQVFRWTSSNPSVVSVNANGQVTAVGDGAATISASSGGVTGTATVTVSRTAASVAVTPATVTINALGGTQQLTATASDANRNPIPSASVTWTSSNPSVATVSGSGMVTAVSNGTAQITAASGSSRASATVTVAQTTASVSVSPATATLSTEGATQQFTAQAMDANGRPVTGRTFTWTSDAPAVATVSASGVASAVANGAARITATADGRSGSATLTVAVAPRGAPVPAGVPAVGQSVVLRGVGFAAHAGRRAAELTRAGQAALDVVAAQLQGALRAQPGARFEINAFMDNRGAAPALQRTSDQRAAAVVAYLVRKGVSASALTAHGRGSSSPVAPNTTARGRAENQRVELKRTN